MHSTLRRHPLVLALLLAASSAPALSAETFAPPPDAPVSSAESTDSDPYLWLEEVEGERPLTWVKARNALTLGELASKPEFQALEARLLSIYDSDARIPYVQKQGKYYYNFWKDAERPRGLWRRTSLKEYRRASPRWETVLDVQALGEQENESWVWHGATCLEPKQVRCLVHLSKGGADASVVREFDTKTLQFVRDGFYLPEAKSDVAWIDQDHIYVGTDFGAGSLTASGYARLVKRWTRGTPLSSAEHVYEVETDDVGVSAWRDPEPGYERDFIHRSITFWTSELFLLVQGQPVKVPKPDDANASVDREWLFLELRSDWSVDGRSYPAGALLATNLDSFMKGKYTFDVLFEPTERSSLAGFSISRDHLLLNILENVHNRLSVLTPPTGEGSSATWQSTPLPGMPELGTVNAWAIDPDHSNDYFVTITDFVTPTSLYMGAVGQGAPERLRSLPAFWDAAGIEVTQHEATSQDGTRIPYFQVASKDLQANGRNRTLLHGYGGFEVSMLPYYSGGVGAAWLERGGVYVLANIRGGGEFGPRWHQAALKQNRDKAYQDFAAVAQDLIARKVTNPEHLGIEGGSNGGLLMGNMITTWPQLFGAVVCQVPLLDMRRYSKLLAGASWMGEYGDPDNPQEWAWLQNYSPYHKVTREQQTPRTLFMTSTRDDRVHPGHARKMAAKMLDQGHDLLYYENIEGGHGGAADNKQAARMWTLAYTFLWNELE